MAPISQLMKCAIVGLAGMLALSGCAVPQKSGRGRMMIRTEPSTGVAYYLYLPEDYVKSEGRRPPDKKWPIVVTYHGMRPWDSAGAQIIEWQQEADRYGYVVIAPDTRISDMLGELPVRRVSGSLKADERATLAILDEVCQYVDVDPNHVLSTSWSMGGYLAHYMINSHPERFSCLAVRQSNFSSDILSPAKVPEYRDSKIAIFWTENDFDICQRESAQAIEWYSQHGFDVASGVVQDLGHERTPEIAAAFFAKTCAAVPKTPPTELAMRITLNPQTTRGAVTPPPVSASTGSVSQGLAAAPASRPAPIQASRPSPVQSPPQAAPKQRPATVAMQRTSPAATQAPQTGRESAVSGPPARASAPAQAVASRPPSAGDTSGELPYTVRRVSQPADEPPYPVRQVAAAGSQTTSPRIAPAPVEPSRPTFKPVATQVVPPAADSRTLAAVPAGAERRTGSASLAPPPSQAMMQPAHAPRNTPSARPSAPSRRPAAGGSELSPLDVRLSAYYGISPLLLSYTVQMPSELMEGADVLWLDNGQPISHGISGQRSLLEPGRHTIEVLVVTRDNREYRAEKSVTVLERLPMHDSARR